MVYLCSYLVIQTIQTKCLIDFPTVGLSKPEPSIQVEITFWRATAL